MNIRKSIALLGILALFAAACGDASVDSPVTPAADKLTFLFLYTDN